MDSASFLLAGQAFRGETPLRGSFRVRNALLGLDTGGTYTDAALVDAASGDVVATARAPTTHRGRC